MLTVLQTAKKHKFLKMQAEVVFCQEHKFFESVGYLYDVLSAP